MDHDEMFMRLFRGNVTAVGTEQGGCKRSTGEPDWFDRQLNAHLEIGGDHAIGVYPMVDDHVAWGCVDWDNGEGDYEHAANVRALLSAYQIQSWIERSRSKGYHLWTFASAWVPAATMRRALVGACETVGAPTREVNPKQETLAEDQLGNYVRLPYPGRVAAYPGPRRCMISDLYEEIAYADFVRWAHEDRCPVDRYERVMDDLYREPPPIIVPKWTDSTTAEQRLSPLARKMYTEGPLDTADRSAQLWRFARIVAEDGRHTPDEVVQLVIEVDQRWWPRPKYVGRTDGPARIERAVYDAFGIR